LGSNRSFSRKTKNDFNFKNVFFHRLFIAEKMFGVYTRKNQRKPTINRALLMQVGIGK